MSRTVTTVLTVLMLLAAGVTPVAAATGGASATGATQASCSFPATFTDATGTEVTIDERPDRVTTLAPSAAQTMWELGAGDQVVGLTQFALYLEGADSRTNVSAAGQGVSVEKVVGTDPDLVLAPNVIANETVEQLRDAGLTVYKFDFTASLDDIYADVERTGELTGNCEQANETVSSMQDRVETVREAVENSDRPNVFISVGGGWTAGEGTFISQMVEFAGGSNVAAESNVTGYGQISEEVIVEQDPEWIVQIGQYGVVPETEAYNNTYAVQKDQVITVSNENISQPAPLVVNAIEQMAQAFHPEAYAEADATTTEQTDATETSEAMDETETTTDLTTATEGAMEEATTTPADDNATGGVPGFGVPAAVAALAGAAMLARRK
jgi:iron complex transport system substrate-binding protein